MWLLPGGACMVAPGGGVHGCSRGACVVAPGGGMRGCSGGACMVAPGGHAWLLQGAMRGCSGGACVVAPGGGSVWLLGGACVVAPEGACVRGFFDEIRSMSGRYASYWNAFLFENLFIWVDPVRLSSRTNCPLEFELRLVSNLRTCTSLTCLYTFGQVSIYLHPPVLEICTYVNKSE